MEHEKCGQKNKTIADLHFELPGVGRTQPGREDPIPLAPHSHSSTPPNLSCTIREHRQEVRITRHQIQGFFSVLCRCLHLQMQGAMLQDTRYQCVDIIHSRTVLNPNSNHCSA